MNNNQERKREPIQESINTIKKNIQSISKELQFIQNVIEAREKEDSWNLREYSEISTEINELLHKTGTITSGFRTTNIQYHQNWNEQVKANIQFLEKVKNSNNNKNANTENKEGERK